MLRVLALLIGATCLTCACHVLVERTTGARYRRPPHVMRGGHGVVRAHDPEIAETTMRALEALRPRVQEWIGSDPPLPEIWILDSGLGTDSGAHYIAGDRQSFIVMAPTEADWLEHVLCHELGHWYSDGCGVDLPVVVEEGLADLVTADVLPEWAESIRWTRTATFVHPQWTKEEALQLTFETLAAMDGWAELEPRAIGFAIVTELGRDGIADLRELARARGLDHVPAEWFLGEGPGAAHSRPR